MTLGEIQQTVYDALSNRASLNGNIVPVLKKDAGHIVSERDDDLARKHLAVTVGAARFEPTSRDSGTIVGRAKLTVTVYEQPSRNRVGQARNERTAEEEAEAIACALHLIPCGGGVLVFTGIGGVERVDDKTISRSVEFETIATLAGD